MNAMTPAEIVRRAYSAAWGRQVRVCSPAEASAKTYAAGIASQPQQTVKPSATEVRECPR